MLEKMYNAEVEYIRLFSESHENNDILRFSDNSLLDMYTHNFTLIKNDYETEKIKEIIFAELEQRKEKGFSFLRVESNFPIDSGIFNNFPVKPQITKYDYMYIDPAEWNKLSGNKDCTIQKATSQAVMNDGIKVDILANEPAMGKDFAERRIYRKSAVYKQSNSLNLYVCYSAGTPVGNCELMYNKDTAKIEDFDIIKEYQRRGFGTSVLKHLLHEANEKEVAIVYLITESEDTAREMYEKCGFKKVGEKIELFFALR